MVAFRSIAVLTQLVAIESREEMFDMREYNNRLSDAQVVQLCSL
jgi:hypothetical protein